MADKRDGANVSFMYSCVCCIYICDYVEVLYVSCIQRGEQRTVEPLELESWRAAIHHVGPGNECWSSALVTNYFNSCGIHLDIVEKYKMFLW